MGQLVAALTEGRPVAGVLVSRRADWGVLVALRLFDLRLFIAHVLTFLNVQRQPVILHVLFIYFCCLQFFLRNIRCAGGRCQAPLHLPNSHRSNSVTPPERHLVPRASPRGAWPPGSPLLPMRNLMQTHFDHGFLAGLDLPTEKNLKNTQKAPPLQEKKKGSNNPESVCKGGEEQTFTGWAR